MINILIGIFIGSIITSITFKYLFNYKVNYPYLWNKIHSEALEKGYTSAYGIIRYLKKNYKVPDKLDKNEK